MISLVRPKPNQKGRAQRTLVAGQATEKTTEQPAERKTRFWKDQLAVFGKQLNNGKDGNQGGDDQLDRADLPIPGRPGHSWPGCRWLRRPSNMAPIQAPLQCRQSGSPEPRANPHTGLPDRI